MLTLFTQSQKIKIPVAYYNSKLIQYSENINVIARKAIQDRENFFNAEANGGIQEVLKYQKVYAETLREFKELKLEKDIFIETYEPCRKMSVDFKGAKRFFENHKETKEPYKLLAKAQELFFLPYGTERQRSRAENLMEEAGIKL
jgi:hypothetical protein